MSSYSKLFSRFLSLLVLMAAMGWLVASDQLTPLRVSEIEGTAAYESAGEVDWSEVTINLPLLGGDRIISHPDSRVEIELGYANFLRLDENSDLAVASIQGPEVALDLKLGSLILRVYEPERYRVYTPHASVSIKKKGLYRIDVDQDGETYVSVRKGAAEVKNGFRERKVRSGESLYVSGPQSAFTQLVNNYREDDFDLWSDRRDALYITDTSVRYVGQRAGVHDLDYYGQWDTVDSYGAVWFPSVGAGWAPYRTGSWAFYPSLGWTWISYEPWGWLPYHYGDWVYYRPYNRWCWVPGGFGLWFGARVNFFFGNGYVGWAPWGYGYRGGHGHRGGRGGGVSVINNNTTVVNNNFNGWNLPNRNGLTVVRQEDFGRGRPDRVRVSDTSRVPLERFRAGLPEELSRGSVRRPPGERSSSVLAGGNTRPASDRINVITAGSPRVQGNTRDNMRSAPSTWTMPNRLNRNGSTRAPRGSDPVRRLSGPGEEGAPATRRPDRPQPGTSRWSLPSRQESNRGAVDRPNPRPRPSRNLQANPTRSGQQPQVRPRPPRRDTQNVRPQRNGSRRQVQPPSRRPTVRRPTPSRPNTRVTRPPSNSSRTRITRPQSSRPRVTSRPTTRRPASPRPSPPRSRPKSKPPAG